MGKKRFFDGDDGSERQYRMFAIDENGNLLKGKFVLFNEPLDSTTISPLKPDNDVPTYLDISEIFDKDPDQEPQPVRKWSAGFHEESSRDFNRSSAITDGVLWCTNCMHPYGIENEGAWHCKCGNCHNVHEPE